ncbi:MAG: hypothetical protein JWR17_1736 [Pseudomonas sp.]|nr:hypothetical protein [Pseudomonas sp.]
MLLHLSVILQLKPTLPLKAHDSKTYRSSAQRKIIFDITSPLLEYLSIAYDLIESDQ